MAVAASELKARSAVSLFDAALRLCRHSTALWTLSLPGGVAVAAAAISLLEASRERTGGWWPALLFTAAWFFRSACQGAASHWVHQLLVAQAEPTAAASARAALARVPSLFIATAVCAVGYAITTVMTLGIGAFFFSANLVIYAAAMQGKGHPLEVWNTANRLLGPARRSANSVRLCLWSELILIVNLHLGAQVVLFLLQRLAGLDLTFADRYASLDNPSWIVAVVSVSFALLEPLRAALAALLLFDGRVRQEGLDLVSALQQLPTRKLARAAVAALLFAAGPQARGAALSAEELTAQTRRVVTACKIDLPDLNERLRPVEQLDADQRRSYRRFVERLEWLSEDDDCERALDLLHRGLAEVRRTGVVQAATAGGRARAILQRPEFQRPAPAPVEVEDDEESFWDRLWKRISDWLRELFKPQQRAPVLDVPTGQGGQIASLVLAGLLLVGCGIAIALLIRYRPRQAVVDAVLIDAMSQESGPQGESALSRAPEGWAQLADQLAARGQYREAIRGLYLASLSQLHKDGALDYDPSLTNWDHVRRYKGPDEHRPPFRELTVRFDYAFYGHAPCTAEGYQEVRALCRPILEREAAA
jgi:hypothetical protein